MILTHYPALVALLALILALQAVAVWLLARRRAAPRSEVGPQPIRNTGVYFTTAHGERHYIVLNVGSGFCVEFSSGTRAPLPSRMLNDIARAFDTPPWSEITPALADRLREELRQTRGRS